MKKDYKRILRALYSPGAFEPALVEVPAFAYLMASGAGHPQEESYRQAAETLFPVANVAKFISKARRPEEDFVVMPMEVKWKLDRTRRGSARYRWTMMIMQPDCIDASVVDEALRELGRKGKALPLRDRLRLGTFEEGSCGQILHRGPYGEPMERSFDALKKELAARGFDWESDSHDVYYNDARRTEPARLKTLMRVRA